MFPHNQSAKPRCGSGCSLCFITINSWLCPFDWFLPNSTYSNSAKGCESIAYPIRMFCCFCGPIHSTRARDSRVNSNADNWLVTNASVCSERSPGDRGPARSRMRGLFCFAVYHGQAIKLEWKERSLLLALASPQTPIKLVPHNSGGRGDQSSHGETTLHWSMCLFKQEASSLEQELLVLSLVRFGGQLSPDQTAM